MDLVGVVIPCGFRRKVVGLKLGEIERISSMVFRRACSCSCNPRSAPLGWTERAHQEASEQLLIAGLSGIAELGLLGLLEVRGTLGRQFCLAHQPLRPVGVRLVAHRRCVHRCDLCHATSPPKLLAGKIGGKLGGKLGGNDAQNARVRGLASSAPWQVLAHSQRISQRR